MKIDNDIHNYYEHLVLDKFEELDLHESKNAEYLADLFCLALNQLPTRYIRHEVDMAFYLPNSERLQMSMNVENAVKKAVEYLDKALPKKKGN
ncbi:MAG: late competence development ComFB family protein [Pseudomonadota bacterium]